ncbi:MAG: DMT family transporter [Candidatus Nanopelagicales bacterium]
MTEGSATRARHVVLVLAAGALFGTAGTAASFGPDDASSASVGFLRLSLGALALFAIMPFVGGRWRNLPGLWRRPAIWVMAAGAAAYQPFFFGAVERSGVALSTLVTVGIGPVYAGLLGWAFLKVRPTRGWAFATLIAVVGLLLLSWGELRIGDAVGPLMALAAGLGAASYVVAAKHELDRGGHSVELPGAAYLLGSVLLVPIALRESFAWVASPSGALVALYLGIVTMGLANVFAVRGMRGMGPGPAATLLLADPLTATVLGVVVLGETLAPLAVVGLVLVLLGLVLQAYALRPEKPGTEDPPPVL